MGKIVKRLRIRMDTAMDWALTESGKLLQSGHDAPFPACDECELIAPASRVSLILADLPKTRRLSEIAAFAVEESVISDPEKNHVVPGPKLPSGRTLLAVVDREWMRSRLERIEKSGLKPRRMIVESLMPPLQPKSWALVLDESGGFLKTGEYAAHGLDSNRLEPPLALKLALSGDKPEKIEVHARHCPDLEKWSVMLGVPIVKGDEWDWRTHDAATSFDLFFGEFSRQSEEIDWKPYRPALFMILAVLILQFSGIVYNWAHLSFEKKALLSEMAHIFRTTFPEARVIVDAPLQMQRKLEEMRQQGGSDFIAQLASISLQIDQLPPGSLSGIDYSQAGLDLVIDFPGEDALEDFRRKLEQAGIHAQQKKKEARGRLISVRLHIASGAT